MKNGLKIFVLLGLSFLFGGMTLTVLYATGSEIINEGPYMKMVSHSEYATGDNGQIIARLVDWKGDNIVTNGCYASIYYPNKTLYINEQNMTDGGFTGDHYYNFVAVAPEGVYEYQARCEYTQGANTYNATVTNSFQNVPAYNKIDIMEEQISYIETGMQSINVTVISINDSLNTVGQNVLINTDLLNNLTTDVANIQFDTTNSYLVNITTDVDLLQVLATETNQTTQNTYTYITGTLATNVNSILGTVGIINQTVSEINSTVTTIQSNQERIVHMTTF